MVFIKPTKFKNVFRLILDNGEGLNEMKEIFLNIETEKYQIITVWDVWEKSAGPIPEPTDYLGKFLGFSTVKQDHDKNLDRLKEAIDESRKNGIRIFDNYNKVTNLIDIEIKCINLASVPDNIRFGDNPIDKI